MLSAVVASVIASAISVAPADACPTAEVEADTSRLHIVIRDRRGLVLGSRKVDAPADCPARAAQAAVLIAA